MFPERLLGTWFRGDGSPMNHVPGRLSGNMIFGGVLGGLLGRPVVVVVVVVVAAAAAAVVGVVVVVVVVVSSSASWSSSSSSSSSWALAWSSSSRSFLWSSSFGSLSDPPPARLGCTLSLTRRVAGWPFGNLVSGEGGGLMSRDPGHISTNMMLWGVWGYLLVFIWGSLGG